MCKSTAKFLFFLSSLCFVLTATAATARAQCGDVYSKRTTRKILSDQVIFPYDPKYLKDFTGDGRIDLIGLARDAATGSYNKIYILPNDGGGNFGAPIYINLPTAIESSNVNYLITDFNNDGKPDLAVKDYNDYSKIPSSLISATTIILKPITTQARDTPRTFFLKILTATDSQTFWVCPQRRIPS